jgi:hypothetical protein
MARLRLQSSCHIFSKEGVKIVLLRVAIYSSAWFRNRITGIVESRQINVWLKNSLHSAIKCWKVKRIVILKSFLCSRELLLLGLLKQLIASFNSMLQEVECLVGSISLLVQGEASCLSLIILIDWGQVNARVGSLKFFNFTVKLVLFELSSVLTKNGLIFGKVLVVLDETLGEATGFLKSLTTWKLSVHFFLEVAQSLTGVSYSLDFVNGLSFVASVRHEICHVHA